MIAREASRDVRGVREHIEKARLERDFEAALREQLRDALRSHQQDMMDFLGHLRLAVHTPELTSASGTGMEFGLEDLWQPAELAQHREMGLGPTLPIPGRPNEGELQRYGALIQSPAVKAIRDADGPQELQLAAEGARLWRALKEHLGKDPLWRLIADWKQALLKQLQAQTQANRSIRERLEQDLKILVQVWRAGDQGPHLSPIVVSWARARATRLVLGEGVPDLAEIRTQEHSLHDPRTSHDLALRLEDPVKVRTQFDQTMEALPELPEVQVATQAYRNLQEKTRRVHDVLEELLLIHHIPGRCTLCKKLAGQ